jgi:RNAse (barnase) inhibitor barstar
MKKDDLLKKVFQHQMMLLGEIEERLKDNLTEPLQAAFSQNKNYLQALIQAETIDTKKLNELQSLWEKLTKEIEQAQRAFSQRVDLMNAQQEMAKLYS